MEIKKAKDTMLVLSAACLVWYFISKKEIALYIGFGVACIGFLSDTVSIFIHTYWMKLAHFMGKITNGILLSVLFYGILTPMSFIRKMISGNTIVLSPPKGTVWKERNKVFGRGDLEKPW